MTKKKKSPHNWSPEEKLKAVSETKGLSEPDLGKYLRSNGLHSQHIEQWNDEILSALKSKFYPNKKDPKVLNLERKNKILQKDLNRKEKALAEAAALLDFYQRNLKTYQQDQEAASHLLQIGMAPASGNADVADAASWTSVTRAILNLHETITRY